MKKFWMKIAMLVVVAVIVIAGVYVLWHAKTLHTGQIPKQRTSKLATQPKHQLKPEDFQSAAGSKLQNVTPKEQELRQKAALLGTLYRDPNSAESAKARELLLRVPKGVEEQYKATQRQRNLPFLNTRGDQNDIELSKSSQQSGDQNNDITIQMQPQQLSNAQAQNAKELSDKLLEEHLARYKETWNEMFPTYFTGPQTGMPTDILHRLPGPYRRQLETNSSNARAGLLPAGSQQDGVKQTSTAVADMRARSVQRVTPQGPVQSNITNNKTGVGSFKKFNPESVKKPPSSVQRSDANQPILQTGK